MFGFLLIGSLSIIISHGVTIIYPAVRESPNGTQNLRFLPFEIDSKSFNLGLGVSLYQEGTTD